MVCETTVEEIPDRILVLRRKNPHIFILQPGACGYFYYYYYYYHYYSYSYSYSYSSYSYSSYSYSSYNILLLLHTSLQYRKSKGGGGMRMRMGYCGSLNNARARAYGRLSWTKHIYCR